nr:hypothetical protein [uncultured archaeon]
MGFHTRQMYNNMYRGVFVSPLDYNISASRAALADLKEKHDSPLTDKEKFANERIRELERLGGVEQQPQFPFNIELF